MAKSSTEISIRADHNNLLLILVIAVVAFAMGFIIARTRYKAQLKTTYNMVMERENTISDLQNQISEIEKASELDK